MNKHLKDLLTPSWLSGLIAVTVGLIVSAGTVLLFSFNNSQIHQQLVGLQSTKPQPTLTLPGGRPLGDNNNSLQTTWPLLAFWGIIGLAAYVLVEYIVKIISQAAELKNELNYVHVRRNALLKTTAEHLLFILAVLAVWLVFIDLFFKRIIPGSIAAAHAASGSPNILVAFSYGLLSFFMMAGSMHLQAIFMRLTFRRTRLFVTIPLR